MFNPIKWLWKRHGPPNLIVILRDDFLGKKGVEYFREIKRKHGRIDALWMEDGIPHLVHFREGMQIRNWLRQYIPNMGDHWYDENWVHFVEEAIK